MSSQKKSKIVKKKDLEFNTLELSRDEISFFLLEVAKKRNIINIQRRKYISSAKYSVLYNSDSLLGILHETIARTINTHTAFVLRLKHKKIYSQFSHLEQKLKEVYKPIFFIKDISNEPLLTIKEQKITLKSLLKSINRIKNQVNKIKNSDHSIEYIKNQLQSYDLSLNKTLSTLNKNQQLEQLETLPIFFPNISDNLELSNSGNLTGYFLNAFSNNISKDYKKQNAKIRTGDTISYDSNSQIESNDNKQGNVIFNKLQIDTINDLDDIREYNRIIKDILHLLRTYDKQVNKIYLQKNKHLSEEKKSRLAYLFLYILNPKYKGKYNYIKNKLPWTTYLFNKNKEEMANIIQKYFKEDCSFLYTYLNEKTERYDEKQPKKRGKKYYFLSTDTTAVYELYPKGKKTKVVLKFQMYHINNGKHTVIKEVSASKLSDNDSIQETKEILLNKLKSKIIKLKKEATELKNEALIERNAA